MFYEGDLRNGISDAIQHSKLLACFVRDDDEESNKWESEYLPDPRLANLLSTKAILLRLRAGSQEATFLAAICPLPKTPTFVVIHNGQLKEYITRGVSKDDFILRLKTLLEDTPIQSQSASADESAAPSTPSNSILQSSSLQDEQFAPEQQSQEVEPGVDAEDDHSKDVTKDKNTDAAAQPVTNATLTEAEAKTASLAESKRSSDMKYALMQKKRQQDARDERARILRRVQDDKAERKRNEIMRREQLKAADSSPQNPANELPTGSVKKRDLCALQVRLFDGSTIRSIFPKSSMLGEEVRTWIDSHQEVADIPYQFKQVLSPQPNRIISASDETQSLECLGLVPSATIILVPVRDFADAYEESAGATGYITRGLRSGISIVSSGVGIVTGTLGTFLGGRSTENDQPTPAIVKREQHIQGDRQHEFYNGNSLSFEPRPEKEDKED